MRRELCVSKFFLRDSILAFSNFTLSVSRRSVGGGVVAGSSWKKEQERGKY